MKYVVRQFVVIVSIALTMMAGMQPLRAQPPAGPSSEPAVSLPDPRFDTNFAKAQKLVQDQMPDKAFDEYLQIKKDNAEQNPALAADALFRGALLGYNTLKNGHAPGFDKLSPDAQEAVKSKEIDLARKAHDILKQFKDEPKLGDTEVGRYVYEPHWINLETDRPANLKTAIESQIDRRNSDTIQYKVVDRLVRLTGANPNFSYWFALIIIALIVKTITFPLTLKTYKTQREMQRVQPMMKALQDKYKGKPELNEKMMEFYKEHKVNPFASCFPMLIQLPFMYYVYNTIRLYEYHFSHGKFLWIGSSLSHQYSQYVATDLAKFDVPLLVIYALSNYLTMKLNPSPDPAQAQQQKSMSIMMTVMFFFMFMKYQWSAAFIFYWLVLNFISAFQQYNYIFKPNRIKAATPGSGSGTDASSGPVTARSVGGTLAEARPVTPIPGGAGARPRPKARKRK